jgi:hypothetical protein
MKERLSTGQGHFSRCFRAHALFMLLGAFIPSWALAAKLPQVYVRDQQYRWPAEDKRCKEQGLCYAATVPGNSGHDYSMNFIEFRDSGELWDSAELNAALKQLDLARQNKERVIVFIYIHGWHNNAGDRDQGKGKRDCGENLYIGDVAKFEHCGLEKIAKIEPTTPGAAPRVVGIYLAWHGTDFTLFPLLVPYYVPSYIFRRHSAYKVGQTGMERVLEQILCVIQQHRSSYFVVAMGHSFGARALENADIMLDPAYPQFKQFSQSNSADGLPPSQPKLEMSSSPESVTPASLSFAEGAPQTSPQIPLVPPRAALISAGLRVQALSDSSQEAQLRTPQVPLGPLPSRELPIDLVFYVNAATSSYRTIKTVSDWDAYRIAHCSPESQGIGCEQDPLYFAVSSRADILTALVMPIANVVFPDWSTDRWHIISAANTPWMQTHSIPTLIQNVPPTLDKDAFCFQTIDRNGTYYRYVVDPKDHKTPTPFWIMNSDHRYAALEGMLHKIPLLRRVVRHDWVISAHGDVWNRSVFSMIYALIETKTTYTANATCYEDTKGRQLLSQ